MKKYGLLVYWFLLVACANNEPSIHDRAEWYSFEGPQKMWPLADNALVDRTDPSCPIYQSAPSRPYEVLGKIASGSVTTSAITLAKKHGAEALILTGSKQGQLPGGEPIFVFSYKAVRFTDAAMNRHIQGTRDALQWLEENPSGGRIPDKNGKPLKIEKHEIENLRFAWTTQLGELLQMKESGRSHP